MMTVDGIPTIRKRGFSLKREFRSEHNSWRAMHERCTNPRYRKFGLYGGRGIRVCDRWVSFREFLKDMGRKPSPSHSIDRIDNDGNYEPGNCRWATHKEQIQNSSIVRRLTANGKTMCISDWSKETGLTLATIVHRLRRGWSEEKALSVPQKSMTKFRVMHN